MKKILVTSDLSSNAKAGINFAIQLAKQAGCTLVFYHGLELDRPVRWSDEKFDQYVRREITRASDKLGSFVTSGFKDAHVKPLKYELAVERVPSVRNAIVNYARDKKMDFICISTRGAGKLKRIIGTNTSAVITSSPVPVLAIPATYHVAPITDILYASDLDGLSEELVKVKKFATSVKAKITVLHYDYLNQLEEVRNKFEKITGSQKTPGVKYHLEHFNIENSLSFHLENAVKKFNPSIIVLFTKQNRDLYERLFQRSRSAEVSFNSKMPLLIYGKKV